MSHLTYVPPERRRHQRTLLGMMLHGIRLDPDGGDVQDTLHMTDISVSGMGALSDRWLYPGQRIVLCLPVHPEGGRRNLYATIVRCQRLQDGFTVGMEFDRVAVDSAANMALTAAA